MGDKRELEGGQAPPEAKRQKRDDGASAGALPGDSASIAELDDLPGFPPPVTEKCPLEIETMIEGYFKKMRDTNQSVTKQLRSRQDFSNPDMLPNIVKKYGIDQYGTFLRTDVWAMPGEKGAPSGLRKEDYFEEIIRAQQAKKTERTSAPPVGGGVARKSGVASAPINPRLNPLLAQQAAMRASMMQ
eukprot:TRINITY_DN15393_c0_g1_i2.p1 TRINITY_DN15393_c0_g1~~TRINITY_DN15393_c0_g1_i2.p1  ORF type:complete len:187 (+),score=55.93 TRINITY_DN15393_c0_g1_i2:63-623(+)